MVCLGIYAILVKTIEITDIHTSTMTMYGYAVLLEVGKCLRERNILAQKRIKCTLKKKGKIV